MPNTVNLYIETESQEKYKIEEEFLNKLKSAYETYSVDNLFDYLTDDVTYDSMWVLDQLESKTAYSKYLLGKLNTMKNHQTKFNFTMVYRQGEGKPLLIFTPKTPEGDYGAFLAETNEKGKIKAIHLTASSFYQPLAYKDKAVFEEFIENQNLLKNYFKASHLKSL